MNELIINMYCRIHEPDSTVVKYGDKFSEMYFIKQGGARMFNKFGFAEFNVLLKGSFFGDY